mmetsp:Transcript_25949/g.42075  ORF Transcript_25949/g.42075 Transcript_25949/m.42075 type:complete len:382 (+) Transcript_25949:318-1463(+)
MGDLSWHWKDRSDLRRHIHGLCLWLGSSHRSSHKACWTIHLGHCSWLRCRHKAGPVHHRNHSYSSRRCRRHDLLTWEGYCDVSWPDSSLWHRSWLGFLRFLWEVHKWTILHIGPLSDLGQLVVLEELAILEDIHQQVFLRVTPSTGHGDIVSIRCEVQETGSTLHAINSFTWLVDVFWGVASNVGRLLQSEAAFLGSLAVISKGILEDFSSLATLESNFGALEGNLESIAVDFLQKSSTTAEGDVSCRDSFLLEPVQDLGNGLVVNAIALDHPDVGRKQFVSSLCLGHLISKLLQEDFQDSDAGFLWIATVRSHHQLSKAGLADTALDLVLQRIAPVFPACFEDIEGVTHARHQAGGILIQHISHRIQFTIHSPGGDGGVL